MAVNRTPIKDNPGTVQVRTSAGEFLRFTVTAGGPIPIFAFTAQNNTKEAKTFPGHPMTVYEWDHLRDPSQIKQMDLASILLSFFSSQSYEYKVQVCDDATNPLRTAMDIQFTGDPTDSAPESFNVIII